MTLTDRSNTTTGIVVAPAVPRAGRFRPLGINEVQITDGFWHQRQQTNRRATLPHIETWLEREGWLANFDLAVSGGLGDGRRGREFSDSEVYKYLEALAWEIGRSYDDELERRFRAVVSRIGAAQEADGYLGTRFGYRNQPSRWSDLEWGHELYCAGHLFQAAVARARTRPGSDDGLLGIAVRFADLICHIFADGGIERVCGHPEVETGLVELGRVTGNREYIAQAQRFIERRGTGTLRDIEWGRSYYQDDIQIRDATVLAGHAVRANYLAAGAVDVAVEASDHALIESLQRQWNNTVAARTYITGGQGAHHQDEAFGEDWELPPDRAYSETCAGVASIQFSWRLLLHDGNSKYADLIERTLFNVVATSPSDDGTAFYYSNTLQRRTPGVEADPDHASPRAEASLRAPWFEVSCCPPNVARTLASLATYIATTDGVGIQLHQYASASITSQLDNGDTADITVTTCYPATGTVILTMHADATEPWPLSLRIPSWAAGATLTVNGQLHSDSLSAGSVTIRRTFLAGDVLVLTLPMEPRLTHPDLRIDAVRGSVAIELGPTVMALESADIDGHDVADAFIDTSERLSVVGEHVEAAIGVRELSMGGWPYAADAQRSGAQPTTTSLVPYRDWAKRGPSTMRVWIPTA